MWKQVILCKYGVHTDGWVIQDPLPHFPALWRGILPAKEMFFRQVRFRVGKGDKICLCMDLWVGDLPLASTYPELFNCASNQEAKVIDYMERRGDCIIWGPVFRWNFNEVEELQFRSLLNMIGEVFVPTECKDRRIWMPTTDGMFSVAYFFASMMREVVYTDINWTSFWSMKAPPRVMAFGWTALLGGILTMDNLRCR